MFKEQLKQALNKMLDEKNIDSYKSINIYGAGFNGQLTIHDSMRMVFYGIKSEEAGLTLKLSIRNRTLQGKALLKLINEGGLFKNFQRSADKQA